MAETTAKRNYRWRDEKFYARVANSIANRVGVYQEKYNALQSDYQKRNAGRKYTYEDAYVSDSADWANSVSQRRSELDAEADSINAYIDRFTDGLNADWVKQLKSGLTDTKKYQGIMADAATKDHEWWSNFGNEEAYQYAGRADGYSKKYSGMTYEQLQAAFADLDDGEERQWLQYNQGDIYGAGLRNQSDFQQYSQKGAALKYDDFSEAEQMDLLRDGKEYIAAVAAVANNYGTETVRSAGYDQYSALFDMMDEEEFQVLAYCIAKDKEEGTSLTQQYLSSVEKDLENRRGKAIGNKIKGTPVLADLYAANVGLTNFANGFKTLMGLDTGYGAGTTQVAGNTIRESFANDGFKLPDWMGGASVRQAAFDLVSTTANQLPSIAVSSMLSVFNPTLGAVAGTTLMGGSAAGNAYSEAIDKGYGENEAKIYGAGVGILEGSLQYALGGISKLGGAGPRITKAVSGINSGLARFALQWGGNMVSEGIEEGLQEVLDPVLQNAILGADENVNWNEVAYSALLGALSAGTLELGGTISKTRAHTALNNEIVKQYGSLAETLIQEGLESGDGSVSQHLAKKYQKQQAKGKNLSSSQVLEMLTANAESRLSKLGETKNVSRVAELAVKYTTGQEMTRTEKSMLAKSQYGSQVAKELRVSAQAYNLAKQMETLSEAAYKPLEERVGNICTTSESGQAVIHDTNKTVSLDKAEVVKVGADGMTLHVDGEEVSTDNIDFADDSQAYLYSAVSKIENITPGAATAIIKDYDPASGQTVGAYLNGVDEAFTYGYHGYSKADLMAGDYTGKLTDVQRNSAYVLGQSARKITDDAKVAKHKKMRTAAEAKKAEKTKAAAAEKSSEAENGEKEAKNLSITYNKGNGTVIPIDEAGIKDAKRSGAVEVAKILHAMGLGTKIEFFSSYVNKDGDRVFLNDSGVEQRADSGVYRMNDGAIRVDLNDYNGKGLTLNALAHELTHFIQQWSDAKYKVLVEFLMKNYAETGMTMHERVLREQKRLQDIRGKKVSYNEAYDEVVANAMSKMFDDGKLVEKLTELKAQDKQLAQKLWEGFKKILAKFIGIYEKQSALFHDAADLVEMKDTFEQLQNMFAEALVEASENFQASMTVSESQTIQKQSGEQYSSQETDIDTNKDSAYDSPKKETEQEGKSNVTRKEVSHRDNAESSRSVGKENSRGEGSARESCERRIKEILQQKALDRSEKRTDGRGRAELREARESFESRSRRDGLMYVEVGRAAIACKVAPEASWNENAKTAAAKLAQYGFDVVVFTGEMLHNIKGITERSVDGVTARFSGNLTIFISAELDADGMETAYHEAFHASRYGMLAKYHERIANIVASNVDVESESFAQFVSEIADLYAYTESDISASKFEAEIIEEFYAWYVGKTYATISGEMQEYIAQFSDVETIKNQIDGVYAQMEANADKALPGLLEGNMEHVAPAEAATVAKKKGQQYSSQETDLDSNAHPYAYNTLISKPDIVVTTVDSNVPKNRADVVYQAKRNAAKVGKFDPKTGSVSVYVDDVGAEVVLSTNGLKHSLDRRFGVNAPVVLRAGEILHNSIRINEMTPKKEDASESYILVGTARNENGDMYIVRSVINRFSNELASMDVLYAINAKKEPAALLPRLAENSAIRTDSSGNRLRSMRPGFQSPVTDSTISIADLLDLVNQYFPDVLPEDVLKHYGYDARPEGDLGKDALYSGHETDVDGFNPDGKTLDEQLDDILKSAESFDGRYLYIGRITPTFINMLKEYIDIKDLPVVMNYRDAYLSMESKENGRYQGDGINYNNLGKEGMKRAIEAIGRPEQVMLSKKSGKIELVLECVDYKGDKFLSIIALNASARNAKKFIEAHIVTSIYGRRSIEKYVAKAESEGRLIYEKKEESVQGIPQVRYEGDINTNASFEVSVSRESDVVKSEHETDMDTKVNLYSYEGLPADAFYANSSIYSYDFLTSQDPMKIVEHVPSLAEVQTDGKIDYDKTVKLGLQNVEENGGVKHGSVYLLKNIYTKRPLQISKSSITHGLGAASSYAKKTNARLGAVIGEICKNAIPINGMENTHNVRGTYVMVSVVDTTIGNENAYIVALVTVEQQNGMIQSIEHLDVTHALSGRKLNDQTIEKENRAAQGPRAGTKSDSESQFSIISIRDVLGIVNSTHQGYLSDDVIEKLQVERRGPKKGLFSGHETDNISNRDLLANAFEGITQNSAEYKLIQEYKSRIGFMNEYEEKLAKLNAEIRQIRFGTKGKRDMERLTELERQAKQVASNINRNDKKLLSLEASEPLRKVIERERKKEAQKTKENVKEIRQKMKESAAVKEKRAVVEKAAKALMDMLAHPTKDAHVPTALHKPLQEFLEAIDFSSQTQLSGKGMTIRDVAYTRALTEVRAAIAGQRSAMDGAEDGTFELDIPDSFLKEIDDHIRVINSATKGLDLTTNRVYEMNSDELADLGYMLRTINKAIRHIDKLHMAGAKARVSQLGRDTRLEMSKRKPVKGESGGKAMWANFTPWHAFRRMGKAAQQIFKGLMQGQSKLARTIASVIQFAEKTYTAKEAKAWEHKKHTIELDSGKTITMTPAQIMSFYCLSKRQHAKGHMMGGGIRIGTIKNDVKDSVQEHAKELVQKEHYTLTEQDIINIISHLTDRQISVAEALQQYMQNVGGRLNNEISMARWDYMAATEDNYFPIKTDDSTRDVKDPGQEKSNLWALLNKSFTKGLTPGANNAMVVESIFDVFADHMSEVAEYNAFALPLVDAMKWFNYRERIKLDDTHIKDVGVQKSIRDALGTSAVKYFVDLMTDINSSQKAGRHENLAGQILSRSKVASVGWNLRVAIQQPTAILRASLILDAPSLLKGTIRIGTKKLVKEMQQYSGIALWKSMGYYDLNVSRNVREQIKGDDSLMDKFNELGMWLPGKMDEITWARIWAATKAKVAKEQKLSGEDLLQATAELFEEVVYQTQVADSVLTRSSLMRSKTQFMKEATSFMAEPTASVNILLSAFQDYEDGRNTWGKVKRGLAIGFFGYALSASANAIATSLMDAWRDDDEHEEYWEKFVQALLGEKNFLDGNLFSEMNPLEKIVFVRDFISLMKGYDVAPGYADLFQSGIDLVTNYKNFVEGRGSITAYGIVYQTLQVLGNVSGFGASNITREVAGVWNNTIGKLYPDLLLHRYDAGVQNEIRNAYDTGALTYQETVQLLIDNGVAEDEDDAYWTIQKWANGSDYSKYKAVFEAVRNGQSIDEAMEELTSHGYTEKDVRSQIKNQIGKWYQDKAITKQQAIAMLTEYTEMDEEEVTARVEYWDFCDAHPDCDLSESKVGDYKEFADPANISLEVFERFVEETKGLEDIKDEWGDVETSKRDQVLAVIDSLPLTWEQKDALYLAAGYAESKIWDVPW